MEDEWLKKTFESRNMYCGDLYGTDMIISKNKDYFLTSITHEILISV